MIFMILRNKERDIIGVIPCDGPFMIIGGFITANGVNIALTEIKSVDQDGGDFLKEIQTYILRYNSKSIFKNDVK